MRIILENFQTLGLFHQKVAHKLSEVQQTYVFNNIRFIQFVLSEFIYMYKVLLLVPPYLCDYCVNIVKFANNLFIGPLLIFHDLFVLKEILINCPVNVFTLEMLETSAISS